MYAAHRLKQQIHAAIEAMTFFHKHTRTQTVLSLRTTQCISSNHLITSNVLTYRYLGRAETKPTNRGKFKKIELAASFCMHSHSLFLPPPLSINQIRKQSNRINYALVCARAIHIISPKFHNSQHHSSQPPATIIYGSQGLNRLTTKLMNGWENEKKRRYSKLEYFLTFLDHTFFFGILWTQWNVFHWKFSPMRSVWNLRKLKSLFKSSSALLYLLLYKYFRDDARKCARNRFRCEWRG